MAAARCAATEAVAKVEPTSESAYDLAPGLSYLNHASVGTMPRVVRQALGRYLETCETNPWLYVWGGGWSEALAQVHEKAAAFIGCEKNDLALIRNTTAAFGLAANGLDFIEGRRNEVLFPQLNHVGAAASWEAAGEAREFTVRRFDLNLADVPNWSEDDIVSAYSKAISDRTAVLVLPHVDNVLGVRHPVKRIASVARLKGVRFVCVDAAQTVGMLPLNAADLGVDLFATSTHKWVQAPKGTGLMYLSPKMREHLRPQVTTWGQKRWEGTAQAFTDFGTRALPMLLALNDAFDFHKRLPHRVEHYRSLFEAARERVDAHPKLEWRSPRRFEQGASLFAVGVKGPKVNVLAKRLFEENGIVLRAFEGPGRNHLRVSPNLSNSPAELESFFERLDALLS